MNRWRRWETQAIRESRRPAVSKRQSSTTMSPPPAAPRREPIRTEHREPAAAEPGTMLVPIDAWNRVLDQLGNLHEAGKELAEARERAARAEAESEFLRERLADLRAAAEPAPEPVAEAAGGPGRLRSVYREVRRKIW